MGNKSSIDRLPDAVRIAIEDLLQDNRHTLDEILEQISVEFGEENTPSRSALHRRKQRMDEILEKHRQTSQVMSALTRHMDVRDSSSVSRGVIELLRNAVFEVAEDIASAETPDAAAIGALSLAMRRLASAEEVTLKVREKIRKQALEEAAERAENTARETGLGDADWARIRASFLGVEVSENEAAA